jgi:serine/threonine protein kinase
MCLHGSARRPRSKEFWSTIHADQLDELRSTNNDGDESFQANSERIQGWLAKLTLSSYGFEEPTYGFEPQLRSHRIANLIAKMLCINPLDRPSAQTVVDAFPYLNFCCDVNGGAEPFETAERSTAARSLYDRDLSVLEKSRRFYRCSIEGCVKLYPVQDLLKFHEEVCSPYRHTLPELKILICVVRTWRDDK